MIASREYAVTRVLTIRELSHYNIVDTERRREQFVIVTKELKPNSLPRIVREADQVLRVSPGRRLVEVAVCCKGGGNSIRSRNDLNGHPVTNRGPSRFARRDVKPESQVRRSTGGNRDLLLDLPDGIIGSPQLDVPRAAVRIRAVRQIEYAS